MCIPKSDKDRQELKKWRVISLLNVACKMISTCTKERMKKVLSKIIHMDQTRFMSGRFIGKNIRVLYDIMHMAEQREMPGLLLSMDFEKAFDSIAHSFLFECLFIFFRLGPFFTRWIHAFYADSKSCVGVN